MAWQREYLQLKDGTAAALRFRLLHEGANMRGRLSLATHQRDVDGELTSIRSVLKPRVISGFILLRESETAPYGTLAELEALWNSTQLTACGMSDTTFWEATIVIDCLPKPIDLLDYYNAVEIRVEQKR